MGNQILNLKMRKVLIILLTIMLITSILNAKAKKIIDGKMYAQRTSLAEMESTQKELAEKINKLQAEIDNAKELGGKQTVALAQSAGLLDTLKILFLNLALK